MELSQATVDVVSKEGSLSNHAIFVGLFPSQWNDRQIRKLVEGFGPLRKFITPKYSTNALMGFAVYEYVDSNITDTAVAGLDGTRVGDKMLRAGRIRSSSTREKTAQVRMCVNRGDCFTSKLKSSFFAKRDFLKLIKPKSSSVDSMRFFVVDLELAKLQMKISISKNSKKHINFDNFCQCFVNYSREIVPYMQAFTNFIDHIPSNLHPQIWTTINRCFSRETA